LTKIPLTYSVSYFNLGGLGALFGGLSPPKPPRGDGIGTRTDLRAGAGRVRVELAAGR